jgi:hypothetical protein
MCGFGRLRIADWILLFAVMVSNVLIKRLFTNFMYSSAVMTWFREGVQVFRGDVY